MTDLIYNLASILGILFLISAILIHFIKRNYTFRGSTLSIFATGKHGWIMQVAFLAVVVVEGIVSYKFLESGYLVSSILMLIAAAGMLIITFVTYKGHSFNVRLHKAGTRLEFLFFPLSLISYSLLSGKSDFSLAVGLIILVCDLFIQKAELMAKKGKFDSIGLFEKAMILLMNLWLILAPLIDF